MPIQICIDKTGAKIFFKETKVSTKSKIAKGTCTIRC